MGPFSNGCVRERILLHRKALTRWPVEGMPWKMHFSFQPFPWKHININCESEKNPHFDDKSIAMQREKKIWRAKEKCFSGNGSEARFRRVWSLLFRQTPTPHLLLYFPGFFLHRLDTISRDIPVSLTIIRLLAGKSDRLIWAAAADQRPDNLSEIRFLAPGIFFFSFFPSHLFSCCCVQRASSSFPSYLVEDFLMEIVITSV